MDGMARPCGVDIPDTEGSQHAHECILQKAEGSVKPRGAVRATCENSRNGGRTGQVRDARCARSARQWTSRFRMFIEPCQSRVSRLARAFRYPPDAAAIVKRIVPIRLISLICSPTWISTLYRPGFHVPCGG